jgi:hypothetical protein
MTLKEWLIKQGACAQGMEQYGRFKTAWAAALALDLERTWTYGYVDWFAQELSRGKRLRGFRQPTLDPCGEIKCWSCECKYDQDLLILGVLIFADYLDNDVLNKKRKR